MKSRKNETRGSGSEQQECWCSRAFISPQNQRHFVEAAEWGMACGSRRSIAPISSAVDSK